MPFSPEKASEKLNKLTPTQASIVSTSQWFLFHYRNARPLIDIWNSKIVNPRTRSSEKLTLLYLCNELLQQSRRDKKYFEFLSYFSETLTHSFKIINKDLSPSDKEKILKIIKVWKDRVLYSERILNKFYENLGTDSQAEIDIEKNKAIDKDNKLPIAKKQNTNNNNNNNNNNSTANSGNAGNSALDTDRDIAPELIIISSIFNQITNESAKISNNYTRFNKKYNDLLKSDHLPSPHKLLKELDSLNNDSVRIDQSIRETINNRNNSIIEIEKIMKRQKEWLEFENTRLVKLSEMKEDINKRKQEMEKLIGESGGDGEEAGNEEEEEEDENISYKRDAMDEEDEKVNEVDADEDEDEELPTYSHEEESKANENKKEEEEEEKADEEEEEVSPVIDEISSNEDTEEERGIKRVKPNPIDEEDNYVPNANEAQADNEDDKHEIEDEDEDEEKVQIDSETIDHNAALAALLTKLG
ncbi:hypothetical protein BVG19_g872 [[Candida] boidinii]|nr:hypothetical protein BVG19_g872 [[Candida] boidinii]OWB48731.1 hypothetical protein B5S27_g266 [[Candida] boidinii]